MRYHECPACGANLDPGEKCDCYKKMTLGEMDEIYNKHKHDPFRMIWAAYDCGYAKAEKNAVQDAGTSTDGRHQAGASMHLDSTTAAGAMQERPSDMDLGGYKHDLGLAMDVLIFGISRTNDAPENHYERVILRTTLVLLEGIMKRVTRQMKQEGESNG